MIAFEVKLNRKRVCIAGAEDLSVLTASVSALGKLGKKTVRTRPDEATGEIFYRVGGLTSRADPKKNVHLRWKFIPLEIGDVIEVRIMETAKADRPTSRSRAKRTRARATRKRA